MFITHLTIGLLFVYLFSLPLAPALIGAYLPDILDKPLSLIGLTGGRDPILHSWLVLLPFLAWLALDRKNKSALAFVLGISSHLLLDLLNTPGVALFHPFTGYIDPGIFKDASFFPGNILSGAGPWFYMEEKLWAFEILSFLACLPISYLIIKRGKGKR